MKPVFKNKAIVLGTDHHNTLGIIRSLGEEGVFVCALILDTQSAFVAHSKYLKEVSYCSSCAQEVLEALISKYGNETEKPVLIPTCDTAALLIDSLKDKLEECFYIGGTCETLGLAHYMNKLNLGYLAKELGVSVPSMCVCDIDCTSLIDGNAMSELLGEKQIQFPVILKPLMSAGASKSSITVISDANDFEAKRASLPHGKYLIQEFVHIEKEYGVQGISLYAEKKVIVPGVVHKIRTSVNARGSTTYARLTENSGLIDTQKLSQLVLATGYSGIFDIELMQSEDKIYLIEINFRNGAYGYAYTKLGYNLAFEWYRYCVSGEIKESPLHAGTELYLMNETADMHNMKNHTVSPFRWLLQFMQAKVKLIWNIRDPKPLFAKISKKNR